MLSQVRKVPGKEPAAVWAGGGPELDQPRATMVEDKANILVVDDLPEKLLAMEVMLEELGQNVVLAQSGREALRRLLDQDFAVILLDVNMPDMDGFETAALIRQRKRSAHTPIIFLTAYSDEMHAARGYSLGAVDYILAPVVPDVLRTKVKVFVDLFKMHAQIRRQAEERIALAHEQTARAAAEETARRTRFLAEASKVLTSSLDYEATLRALARLLVPYLADLSIITMADEHGAPGKIELACTGATGNLQVRTVAQPGDLPQGALPAIERLLATEQLESLPEPAQWLPGEQVRDLLPGGDEAACFDLKSALFVPLQARGRSLGAMALALGNSGRQYSADDLALIRDLAGRAAIALDNARLYHDIQEGDRLKNEFLSMLAHELRNPLAPIRNAVQILKHSKAREEEFEWARDIIDRQLLQLVRLVDDLLDVSRITRGKIILQPEPLNAAAVVARAVETSRPFLDARSQILTVEMPQETVQIRGDETRLAQVLSNLLNNAAKFTPEGGRIWITLERAGDEALLRVRDTGIGIPAEMLSTIFDLFTQVDRSLDRSQGGLGIGLTLVRRLVEMHGGSVEAHSAGINQGSEFIVRLPVLKQEQTPSIAGNGSVPARLIGPSQRVLIVDDNVDSAESLAVLLRQSGHEVRTTHDGPSALDLTSSYRPEVVLLDIGLPGMDGYEVARRLKQQPGMQAVSLAAVTGYGQEEDRRRSR
ncbi:MAG TPA: response regulator, partial [Gemmataceae bacterium]|nr:response regulator [Gemmataceae bacterium]